MRKLKYFVVAGLLLLFEPTTAAVNEVFRNYKALSQNLNNAGVDDYTLYAGDGSSKDGWPTVDKWMSFDNMWNANKALMVDGCAWFAQTCAENSPTETDNIKTSILQTANFSQVDPRFILAVLMQESRGCVRVKTTMGSHPNPGLMQSHEGENTCYSLAPGQPCTSAVINGMIMDGTSGTAAGDGLAAILQQQSGLGYTGAQLYYRAARVYNSGSVAADGVLEHGIATHCYVSNIANRLTGWAANQASYCCPYDSGEANTCNVAPAGSSSSAVAPSTTNSESDASQSSTIAVATASSAWSASILSQSTSSAASTPSFASSSSLASPPTQSTPSTNQPATTSPTIFATVTRSVQPWVYSSSTFITQTSRMNVSTTTTIIGNSTTTISLGYGTASTNTSSIPETPSTTLPILTITVSPLPLNPNSTLPASISPSTTQQTTTIDATTTNTTTIVRTLPPQSVTTGVNASDLVWPTSTWSTGSSNNNSTAAVPSLSSVASSQLSSLLSPAPVTVTVTANECQPTSAPPNIASTTEPS